MNNSFTVYTARDLARMLVNQLFDFAGVPLEVRQEINDVCDDYVATMITDWVIDAEFVTELLAEE